MKLHKQCKVELTASKRVTRQAIAEPFLSIENGKGTLISTNGHSMAIIPVDIEPEDCQGYVSSAVLIAARKQAKRANELQIGLNGCAKLFDGSTMPREGDAGNCTFPNWKQVLPGEISDSAYTVEIAFDAKLLWELAQAMGTQGVRLVARAGNDGAIKVFPIKSSSVGGVTCANIDAKGLLMPVRVK
jgi:hypothetical protein